MLKQKSSKLINQTSGEPAQSSLSFQLQQSSVKIAFRIQYWAKVSFEVSSGDSFHLLLPTIKTFCFLFLFLESNYKKPFSLFWSEAQSGTSVRSPTPVIKRVKEPFKDRNTGPVKTINIFADKK